MSKISKFPIVILGSVLSLISSLSYSLIYLVAFYLREVDSLIILILRILATSIPIIGFAWYFIGWGRIKRYLLRLRIQPIMIVILILHAIVVSYQTWLFTWAPANGYGLDLSMGYLILPLMIIITGKLIFKEQISLLKGIAIALVTIGVATNLVLTQHFSIYTLSVAILYAIMFTLRRIYRMDGLAAVAIESFALLIVATIFITIWFSLSSTPIDLNFLNQPNTILALLLLAILSFTGWITYIFAGKFLTFNLWGLLSFIEVILLLFFSILIGEHVEQREIPMYILLISAMIVMIIENIYNIIKDSKTKNNKFHNSNQ